MDLQEAFDAGFVAVKAYIDDALAVQREAVADLVKQAVAELPKPLDGKDGQDAASVSAEQVADAVRQYLEANPPAPGEPGKDGIDGKDGKDGHDALDGKDGERGLDGKDGRDGCDVTDALVDRDGNLVVVFADGRSKALGLVVGRDGLNGKDGEAGRDGLTLTDFDTKLSADGRVLSLILDSEAVKITHDLQLNTMIYRGGYQEGVTYVEGDTVTFGGSLWCCCAETTEKPVEDRGAWRLAARKGRDGKDAKGPA